MRPIERRSHRSRTSRVPGAMLAVAILGGGSVASAESPQASVRSACIAASEGGQVSRKTGLLRAAHDAFLACSKSSCPQTVRLDCAGWLEEVDKSLPTVVVRALDGRGAEVTEAQVWFDRELLLERLLGSAVAVDPGEHTFVVKLPSGQVVERRVVVREGEKAQPVLVQFPPDAGQGSTGAVHPEPAAAPVRTPTTTNLIVGSIVGAVGLGALGGAIYFETQQASEATTLRRECPRGCSSTPTLANQVSSGKTDETIEGVSFAISGVALAAAAYLFIAQPFRAVPGGATATFELAPSTRGGAARWTLHF